MQLQRRSQLVLMTLAVLVFLAAPSWAAKRGGPPDTGSSDIKIARANLSPHLVSFEPLVDYETMTLTVRGNRGLVFQGEFRTGAAVLFDLFDDSGKPLEDGVYVYELKATPRIAPEIRLALESARQSGDDAEAEGRLRAAGILPRRDAPMSLSGAFTIVNGAVADPDLPESGAARAVDPGYRSGVAPQDFVINDDLIVTGSACIGFDCTNGLAFGFDTLILKENNLRMFFDDTSNSASFPRNDWRLIANDTTNGGQSRFSIEDSTAPRTPFTIEAGARNNALYVDDGGRIGIGTNTPVVNVHVLSGNTPTLRLDQDGSSGFAAQVWDVAGNETNFFIRDVTNGSTLPFRIRPGAPTSSIDISGSGFVGIRTSSPNSPLTVNGTGTPLETARFQVSNTDAMTLFGSSTVSQLFLNSRDLTAGQAGPSILLGLNSNNDTAGTLRYFIRGSGGSGSRSLWVDASGLFRINSTPPTSGAGDTAGTVVGDQTSFLKHPDGTYNKLILGAKNHPEEALRTIAGTKFYDFRYANGAYNNTVFTGPIAEESPWLMQDPSPEYPGGRSYSSMNHSTLNSLAIQALLERISRLEKLLAEKSND